MHQSCSARDNLCLSTIDLGIKLPDAPESNMTSMDCPPMLALNTNSVLPTLGSEDSHSHNTLPSLLNMDRDGPRRVFCCTSPCSWWSFSVCVISRFGGIGLYTFSANLHISLAIRFLACSCCSALGLRLDSFVRKARTRSSWRC